MKGLTDDADSCDGLELERRRRRKQKMAKTSSTIAAMPPTTPPTIAPTGECDEGEDVAPVLAVGVDVALVLLLVLGKASESVLCTFH